MIVLWRGIEAGRSESKKEIRMQNMALFATPKSAPQILSRGPKGVGLSILDIRKPNS